MATLALFDLDNTLVDRTDAVRRWAIDFCAARDIDPATGLAWILDADNDGATYREPFMDLLGKRFDLPDDVSQLVREYQAEIPRYCRLYPDVANALATLREAGWRVGIVTNGLSAQVPKIMATGLDAMVDGWANSGDEGVAKPDPKLFDIAAQRCGFATGSDWRTGAWMVGDSARSDIGGARACGIDSIWLHRLRSWEVDEYQPTRVAMSVSDAVTMILEPELHLPATISY